MVIQAIIEIEDTVPKDLRARLARAAYRASRRGTIVLVAPRRMREEFDRALDPVVEELGLDVDGILYLDVADAGTIGKWVRSARLVALARSRRRSAERLGARVVDLSSAYRWLLAAGTEDRGTESPPPRRGPSAARVRATDGSTTPTGA